MVSQNLRKIIGDPCVSEMAPFCALIAAGGTGIMGKIKGRWRRAEMIPKMGTLSRD